MVKKKSVKKSMKSKDISKKNKKDSNKKNNSSKKNSLKSKNKKPTKEEKKKLDNVVKRLRKDLKTEGKVKDIKSKKSPNKNIKKESPRYIQTGMKGFDALFDKNSGIPDGAAVLVEGGPGSGKTIFCLATLNELCKKGKKGLYMSFEEPEENLISHMENFGWKPREYIKKGLLRIKRFDAIDVSRSIEALLSAAKKELLIEVDPVFFPQDYNPDFVVIDSLTSIASAFSGQQSRFRIYMEQLFRYLERNKITNFLIREVSSPSHVGTTFTEQGEAVSFLSDGIIVIYNVIYDNGQRGSAIEVLKMRGSNFTKKIVDLQIVNKKGVMINPNKILDKKKKNFNLT